ncbi:MAG: 1-aminocyclopropane-1-carboxylate deaminase [Halieaceae bacterium]
MNFPPDLVPGLLEPIDLGSFGIDYPIALSMARLDTLDPEVGGNKLFKLAHNLEAARTLGKRCILSFGGAWSNHLHALAALGRREALETIGIVRGEPTISLNPTLADAQAWGMRLEFVSRAEYRQRNSPDYLNKIQQRYPHAHLVPEGGANIAGAAGCQEIAPLLVNGTAVPDLVACACGTGTMLSGLIATGQFPLVGYSVLRDGGSIERGVVERLQEMNARASLPWHVVGDYHGGGYAQVNSELRRFLGDFTDRTNIPLDPVYTGKLMFGLLSDIALGRYAAGGSIVAIHSGGLQGRRGFKFLPSLPTASPPG